MKKPTNQSGAWVRGVVTAAAVADSYNASTTHEFRLGDCILGKLNLRGKPRRNRQKIANPDDTWMIGAAVALAEVHRMTHDGASIRHAATTCGLTLAYARRVGVSAYALKELKKAGVR